MLPNLGYTLATACSQGASHVSKAVRPLANILLINFNSMRSVSGGKDNSGHGGPGPGPRTRSMDQAAARAETSDTSGQSAARSPDAPADPADLAYNRGSDPDQVLRTASQNADQALASSYSNHPGPDTGGSHIKQAPHMAGRFAEKVAGAANVAAQAVTGAASAMSNTVKAATGAGVGINSDHHGRTPASTGPASADRDGSPVSDRTAAKGVNWDQQYPDTNPDTAGRGEMDTASGTSNPEWLRRKTEQGGYKEAANKLQDIEGEPRKY